MNITVTIQDRFKRYTAGITVDEFMVNEAFMPLKTTDEPLIAYATGELVEGSAFVQKVVKTREDAAERISEILAEILVNEMKKNDTHNGYRINDRPEPPHTESEE